MTADFPFHFLRPLWLLAIPISLVVYFYTHKAQTKINNPWQSAIAPHLLSTLHANNNSSYTKKYFPMLLGILSLILLLALAGPTWRKANAPVEKNSSILAVVVDLSPQMNTNDLLPDRITRMQRKLTDLFNARKDGTTAIIAFSAGAHTVAPLTDDIKTLSHLTKALSPNIMPAQGKNSVAGIKKAIQLLEQSSALSGDILLLSNTVSQQQIKNITQLISQTPYQLHVLGVGTVEGAPIRDSDNSLMRGNKGEITFSQLDPDKLLMLAEENNGLYRTITVDEQDINDLLVEIEKNLATEATQYQLAQWYDDGIWLTLLLIPFALAAFRKGWVCPTLFIALLFTTPQSEASLWDRLWKTPNQQGMALMEENNYNLAAETFTNPAWKAEALDRSGNFEASAELSATLNTDLGYYNQGNALTRAGKLDEAIQAYDKALQINSDLKCAQDNRQLILDFLAKKESDSEQQNSQDNDSDNSSNNNKDASEKNSSQSNANNTSSTNQEQQNGSSQANQASKNPTENPNTKEGNKGEEASPNSSEKSNQKLDNNQAEDKENKDSASNATSKENTLNQDEQLNNESTDTDNGDSSKQDNNTQNNKMLSNNQNQNQTENDALAPKNNGNQLNKEETEKEKLSQQELENWFRKIQGNPDLLLKHKFYIQQQQSLQEQRQWQ